MTARRRPGGPRARSAPRRAPEERQPAFHLREFLESDEARPIRIVSEYLEPLRRFRDQQIQDTVVFFGSARVHSRERAEHGLRRARRTKRRVPAAELVKWEHAVEWSRYYEDARTLSRLLSSWALTLDSPPHRFVVCSGGGPGIMEAANRGAHEAGAKTIGLNIQLPHEQGLNPYVTPGLGFDFHYFFMRKFWFAYLAKALVIFPGGFGTLDELFEFLTLTQTKKLSRRLSVILYGPEYWHRLVDFEEMLAWDAIAKEDLDSFTFCASPDEAFAHLKRHLIRHFLKPTTKHEAQVPALARTRPDGKD
jgi:uncharacterized protein (TIGR00730 family)